MTKEHIEKNFINILNNLWNGTGLNFFLKEIEKEDEIRNLMNHYLSCQGDYVRYPPCKKITQYNYQQETRDFPMKTFSSTSSGNGPFNSNTKEKPNNKLIYPYLTGLNDSADKTAFLSNTNKEEIRKKHFKNELEKKEFAELDVFILKEMLSKDIFDSNLTDLKDNTIDVNHKKVISGILRRMTDESLYLEKHSKDLHIYLIPYIKADNILVFEGRDDKNGNTYPIVLMSMYYKDCNKMKPVVEAINSEKICGSWITDLMSSYKALQNAEEQYNKIAKFKLVEKKECKPKQFDPSIKPTYMTLLNDKFEEEKKLLDKIDDIKKDKQYKDVKDKYHFIHKKTEELRNIYEYDYNKDVRIKKLKRYKGKTLLEFTDPNPTYSARVQNANYSTMVELTIKHIKKEQKKEIKKINKEIKEAKSYIKVFLDALKKPKDDLKDIQSRIEKDLNYDKSTLDQMKILKKIMDQKKKETIVPMYYAEKIRPMINVNTAIVSLFIKIEGKLMKKSLRNHNKDVKICTILDMPLNKGGAHIDTTTKSGINLSKDIINARRTYKYLKFPQLEPRYSYIQFIKKEKLNPKTDKLEDDNRIKLLGNKSLLDILTNQTYININEHKQMKFANQKCEESQKYEVLNMPYLDLDGQYHLVNQILADPKLKKRISFNDKKKIEKFIQMLTDKCLDLDIDYTNKRAEPDYIKNDFFNVIEAIENYKWLLSYIHKNNFNIQNKTDEAIRALYQDIQTLLPKGTGKNIMANIKSTIIPTQSVFNDDAISCPGLDKDYSAFFSDSKIKLNSYILEKQNCNNSYLDQFKESYI